MDDNFVWCALIFAMAYIFRDTVPSYSELSNMYDRRRVDAINRAVNDNEQTMLAIGSANEKMQRRLEVLESDVGGHFTRLDDVEERVIGYGEWIEAIENKKIGEVQLGLAGHLTRMDDLEARIAVVEGKTKRFAGDAS